MQFGKLDDISEVDFSMPPDPISNQKVYKTFVSDAPTVLYLGVTSWAMKEWKGKWYPSQTRQKDFVSAYGKQFNTIELNTTHYGTPSIDTIQRWYDHTPEDFIFCPKIHKAISHRKTLGTDSDIIENTVNTLSLLDKKLGPFFIQFPPYFSRERIDNLEHFLKVFPTHVPLSIELRHPSWFATESALIEAQDLCIAYGKDLLMTDVSGRRDVLHMHLCNDSVMVRFVGNGLHPTDYTRLDAWVERLSYYSQKGIKKIYFFAHEPDNVLAPDLAAYICDGIRKKTNIITRGPRLYMENTQLNLF